MVAEYRGNALELDFRLFELSNAVMGAFFDDFFERIARMKFERGEVDGNRCGKDNAVPKAFHTKVGIEGIFFTADICKANEIVLYQVFHKTSSKRTILKIGSHSRQASLDSVSLWVMNAEKIGIDVSWKYRLEEEFKKPYMRELEAFLEEEEREGQVVYPAYQMIFNAFCYTPFEATKVVVMGQDPYHGKGQAHGLSFSVEKGVAVPPSLLNIYKELESDVGGKAPEHGNLVDWAKQGVLLLNATLTVREGSPKSHYGKGWERFTDRVVRLLAERRDPLVFLLWGRSALEKIRHAASDVSDSPHLILKSPHPSPLSAYSGFFGCRHFSQTNIFLKKVGKEPIDWMRLGLNAE